MAFRFPAHGPNFQYTLASINGRTETARLCRFPPCTRSSESPEAYVFHQDCYLVARCQFPTLSPFLVWHVGISGLSTPQVVPPRATLGFVKLSARMHPGMSITGIIERLETLPPELFQLVASYCCESPLWRYSAVIGWFPEELSRLETGKLATPLVNDPSWLSFPLADD